MKRQLLFMLAMCLSAAASAQLLTREYQQVPLPEVLIDIDNASPELQITFIYDNLEDYTVTCSFSDVSPIEAIHRVVGFYPVKIARTGQVVSVEPIYSYDHKIIGRLVDENGEGVEFADISVFALPDTSYIASAVTTEGGDFVIPVEKEGTLWMKIRRMGYLPLSRPVTVGSVGNIFIHTDATRLKEIEVHAQPIRAISYGIAATPSEEDLRRSSDAFALMNRMMIPGLQIDQQNRSASVGREGVAYHINGLQAEHWEVAALPTKRIARIEFLAAPPDPKYHNAQWVLNFVLKEQAYGGYTMVEGQQGFVDHRGNLNVATKMNRGKMTYLAMADATYSNISATRIDEEKEYRFAEDDVVKRASDTKQWTDKQQYTGAFVARYNDEGVQLQGSAGFRYTRTSKEHEERDMKDWRGGLPSNERSSSDASGERYSPYVRFSWELSNLPRKAFLSGSASLTYNRNVAYSTYAASRLEAPLRNDSKEDAWIPSISLAYQLPVSSENSLKLSADFSSERYSIDYVGTAQSHQRLVNNDLHVSLRYNHVFSDAWHGSIILGMPVKAYKVNDLESVTRAYLNGYFRLNGRIGTNHSFSGYANVEQMPLSPQYYNTVIRQDDDLQGAQGTTDLKVPRFFDGYFQHTWVPSNTFSLATSVGSYGVMDDLVADWRPENGLMVRTMVNGGNYYTLHGSVTPSLSLLNRKLRISMATYFAHEYHGGEIYRVSLNNINLMPSVGWDVGSHLSFDMVLSKSMGKAYMRGGTGPNVALPTDKLVLTGTYSAGNLFVTARLNWSLPKYGGWEQWLDHPSMRVHNFISEPSDRRCLLLSARYTFDFGRKVKRDSNANYEGTTKSAVLSK